MIFASVKIYKRESMICTETAISHLFLFIKMTCLMQNAREIVAKRESVCTTLLYSVREN